MALSVAQATNTAPTGAFKGTLSPGYPGTSPEPAGPHWQPTGERFDVHHHIYGSDLDLFGADSLFELLCAARTQMGENTLAQWLLAPADIETIRERHASISDLRDRLDLREELAVHG